MLDVVAEPHRIGRELQALVRRLGGVAVPRVALGRQGGNTEVTVRWRRDDGLWWHFATGEDRYSLGFGVTPLDPPPQRFRRPDAIACQFDMPLKGPDRRYGGVLVRDEEGRVYLAHSGRVGGTRAGRSRLGLRAWLRHGNWQMVRWPDGKIGELCLIGQIGGPRIARHIARFVREVRAYKDAGGDQTTIASQGIALEGPRLDYRLGGEIATQCDHGLVVDALRDELARRGIGVRGGGANDLFSLASPRVPVTFEIGTDASVEGVHRVIGRLLARLDANGPGSIAVVPVSPEAGARCATTLQALEPLGIRAVCYRWRGARPVFDGLDAALDGES